MFHFILIRLVNESYGNYRVRSYLRLNQIVLDKVKNHLMIIRWFMLLLYVLLVCVNGAIYTMFSPIASVIIHVLEYLILGL